MNLEEKAEAFLALIERLPHAVLPEKLPAQVLAIKHFGPGYVHVLKKRDPLTKERLLAFSKEIQLDYSKLPAFEYISPIEKN